MATALFKKCGRRQFEYPDRRAGSAGHGSRSLQRSVRHRTSTSSDPARRQGGARSNVAAASRSNVPQEYVAVSHGFIFGLKILHQSSLLTEILQLLASAGRAGSTWRFSSWTVGCWGSAGGRERRPQVSSETGTFSMYIARSVWDMVCRAIFQRRMSW